MTPVCSLALLQTARRYAILLGRSDVPWVELRTDHPGRIVYEDAVQAVAVQYVHEEHWRSARRIVAQRAIPRLRTEGS